MWEPGAGQTNLLLTNLYKLLLGALEPSLTKEYLTQFTRLRKTSATKECRRNRGWEPSTFNLNADGRDSTMRIVF